MNPLKTFSSKTGKTVVLRYPTMDDVQAMTDYINAVSLENTYILFSGEQLTVEQEREYMISVMKKIESGDLVKICAFIDGKYVGSCEVERMTHLKKRALHVGGFAISLAKEARGEGIGYELARTTIQEAKNRISGLKSITLECFSTNTPALKLYEKLGFSKVGQIPKKFLHGTDYVDEVIYHLEVASTA